MSNQILEKKIPSSIDIQRLKSLVCKLFKESNFLKNSTIHSNLDSNRRSNRNELSTEAKSPVQGFSSSRQHLLQRVNPKLNFEKESTAKNKGIQKLEKLYDSKCFFNIIKNSVGVPNNYTSGLGFIKQFN